MAEHILQKQNIKFSDCEKTHFWDVVHTKWSHRGAFPDGTQTAPGTRGHTTLLSFLTLFKRKTKTEKHP